MEDLYKEKKVRIFGVELDKVVAITFFIVVVIVLLIILYIFIRNPFSFLSSKMSLG